MSVVNWQKSSFLDLISEYFEHKENAKTEEKKKKNKKSVYFHLETRNQNTEHGILKGSSAFACILHYLVFVSIRFKLFVLLLKFTPIDIYMYVCVCVCVCVYVCVCVCVCVCVLIFFHHTENHCMYSHMFSSFSLFSLCL